MERTPFNDSLSQSGPEGGSIALLRKELHLAGVPQRNLFPPWAWSRVTRESILREFLVALDTPVHEGLISPYGALLIPKDTELSGHLLPLGLGDLDLARKAADGSSALLVWDEHTLRGMLLLDPSLAPDLELTRIARPRNGIAIRRDSNGVVRIYEPHFTLRHAGRRWTISPTLGDAIDHILKVVGMADRRLLFNLLEFAYYVLSPWRIGATLVWILSDREPAELTTDLRPFRLSLDAGDGEPSLSFAAHLLAQFDGATVINRTGRLVTTGVHLTASRLAHELIPARPGTRHTSARRASFDLPDTLVVTVSADGPVSVFSDGVDIFDLWFFSAAGANEKASRRAADDAKLTDVREHTCPRCGKTSSIETLRIGSGPKGEEARCPVCGDVVDQGRGVTMRTNIKKVF